jgi:hypothetical protein
MDDLSVTLAGDGSASFLNLCKALLKKCLWNKTNLERRRNNFSGAAGSHLAGPEKFLAQAGR